MQIISMTEVGIVCPLIHLQVNAITINTIGTCVAIATNCYSMIDAFFLFLKQHAVLDKHAASSQLNLSKRESLQNLSFSFVHKEVSWDVDRCP